MPSTTLLTLFLSFLTVAVLVAYAARRLRVPYTIAMVLAGLGLTLLRIDPEQGPFELEPELIFLIFLPGLLFEASYHIDLGQLRQNLRAILLLAIPGILLSTGVVGGLLYAALGIDLPEALLFGVLISATDPIAVVALFKELGVEKRLGIIIEGESLFNDGVAIVLYTILAGIAAGTGEFTISGALIDFFVTMAGGAALGSLAGFLFAELMKRTRDPLIHIALTTILSYGLYLFAHETLHELVSPVVAVVVAGIVVGNYGASGRHSAVASNRIVSFWEFGVFVINSAVFLLIGLRVEVASLVTDIAKVGLTILAVLIARALVVYLLRLVINRKPPELPLSWGHVMVWGGMRGAVSIALVLSLPFAVASRELFITMAFGYVIFSVVFQGLTLSPLLARLGLTWKGEKQLAYESRIAEMAMAEAAGDAVDEMREDHFISSLLAGRMMDRVQRWVQAHEDDLVNMVREEPGLAETNRRMMVREVTNRQQQTLRRLLQRGLISEKVFEEYSDQLGARIGEEVEGDWLFGGGSNDEEEGADSASQT